MTLSDLDGVVRLHKHCFPDSISIFTALSDDIVKRFYAQVIEEPECVAAVLEEPSSGRVVGLAFGTMKPGFQRRFLRRHFFCFVWGILSAFIVNPVLRKAMWARFKRRVRLLLQKRNAVLANSTVPPPKGPEASYILLGVHTQWRGRGNAGRLVEYFTTRMFETGAARINALIRLDNLPSLKVHKRLGWNMTEISPEEVCVWIDRPDLNS